MLAPLKLKNQTTKQTSLNSTSDEIQLPTPVKQKSKTKEQTSLDLNISKIEVLPLINQKKKTNEYKRLGLQNKDNILYQLPNIGNQITKETKNDYLDELQVNEQQLYSIIDDKYKLEKLDQLKKQSQHKKPINNYNEKQQQFKSYRGMLGQFKSLYMISFLMTQFNEQDDLIIYNCIDLIFIKFGIKHLQIKESMKKLIKNKNSIQYDQLDIQIKKDSLTDLDQITFNQCLPQFIQLSTLKLDLSENKLYDIGTIKIAKSLSNLKHLEQLDLNLHSNHIGNEGIQELGLQLSTLNMLKDCTLFLYRNDFQECSSLGLFKQITDLALWLQHNQINYDNLKKLGKNLIKIKSLKNLDLEIQGNDIFKEFLLKFKKTIKKYIQEVIINH